MKLKTLSPLFKSIREAGEIQVSGLASDSRQVKPGDLFFALHGVKADGTAFVADAAKRGAAAAIVSAGSHTSSVSIPVLPVDDPRLALAQSAAAFFGKQPDTMIAVTGTSGKTSVTAFTRQIWEKAGIAAASIGTTGVVAPGRNEYGTLTTPDPIALHLLLKELADSGVTHASMEASSHGLDQCRLDGVKLKAGAFTNLGRDHLDYHPTIENYHAAKLRLFDTLLPKGAPAVIFADDVFSKATEAAAKDAGLDVRTVGRKGSFIALKRVEHERHRQRAEVSHDGVIYEIDLPLAGDFQIYNALVSAGLAISTGVAPSVAFKALETLEGAPGRLDYVASTRDGCPLYVDYAHKPEALENVLAAVRPFTTGRVVVVFGCGGDRDKGKRPIMGGIASRLADVVIVTDDNPRSEVPETIRGEILSSAPGAVEIADRAKAIREAVSMLKSGDTLIVAGKGHEEGQTAGGVTHPFSDHAELRKALAELAA
jgi:UDP-N-acetylmuramoyl-L-alanyl-D-glutamate--2,6-diaminopimelate ligase